MATVNEDQLRVAKLVIAGWIKNWNCVTLYQAITGKPRIEMDEVKELCNKYKFLPSDWFWYFGKGGLSFKAVRKYIADLDKKLSDALWDTEDNMKKLGFASYLAKLNGTGVKTSSKFSKEDNKEHAKDRRKFRGTFGTYEAYKEHWRKMNNSDWNTVK